MFLIGDDEGGGGGFGFLSKQNLQYLLMRLEYADRISYKEWLNIAMLWFQEKATREEIMDILYSAQAGRIAKKPEWKENEPKFLTWVPEEQSLVMEGDRPSDVPGLILMMTKEIRRQIAITQDVMRVSGKDLDVQGFLSALEERQGLTFQILAEDVFIRGMDEGQIVIITGVPGSGKSHFALQHIAAPALEKGWVVVSNIQVVEPPENYVYVNLFSTALIACIDATLEGKKVILLQDEGGLSREKSKAQTNINRSQAAASKVSRKLGFCHVIVYQFQHDVPREVERMATHVFRKPSKENTGMVYCETPFLNSIEIEDLPSIEELKETERPYLEYRTKDFSPFEVDADFSPLLQYELSRAALRKKDFNEEDQLKAIRKRLEEIIEGPTYFKPLDLDQLHRIITVFHLDDPGASKARMLHLFRSDFEACTMTPEQAIKTMETWGFAAHPPTKSRIAACKLHQAVEGKDWLRNPVPVPPEPAPGSGDHNKPRPVRKIVRRVRPQDAPPESEEPQPPEELLPPDEGPEDDESSEG